MTFEHFPPTFITEEAASRYLFHRIEALPRTDDLEISLRAEIADPLWMLARQRQFGELTGEDAGSPIDVRLDVTSARISRLRRGGPAGLTVDVDDSVPLEAVIEAEPRLSAGEGVVVDPQVAVRAGLHWLRLLQVHGIGHLREAYLQHCAVTAEGAVHAVHPIPDADRPLPEPSDAAAAFANRVAGRVPDGRQLVGDFRPLADASGAVTGLPASPAVPPADAGAVLTAAALFLTWWDDMVPETAPVIGDAWSHEHLEHRFAVEADLGDGPVVLAADEYRGGRLDWYSFRAAEPPGPGEREPLRPPDVVSRSLLPTPVAYGGMPADRFWAIEDGTVRFGGLETGRTDLARLLLTEFALIYGNDWFVVPVDLDVGTVCRIDSIEVVDTFGVATTVTRPADPSWRVFEIDAPDGADRISGLSFLAPVLHRSLESEPVEEVGFVRDELANVVWAVERSYRDGAGLPVDRRDEHQQRIAARQTVELDHGDAELVYRLATDVPYHWFPFVPVQAPGAPPSAGAVVLERRSLQRALPDGTTGASPPLGRLLSPQRYQLAEEEVPRSGTDVVRTHQLTRWTDGRYHLWTGRKRLAGRGEGSSGLRFDVTSRPSS